MNFRRVRLVLWPARRTGGLIVAEIVDVVLDKLAETRRAVCKRGEGSSARVPTFEHGEKADCERGAVRVGSQKPRGSVGSLGSDTFVSRVTNDVLISRRPRWPARRPRRLLAGGPQSPAGGGHCRRFLRGAKLACALSRCRHQLLAELCYHHAHSQRVGSGSELAPGVPARQLAVGILLLVRRAQR